MEPKNSINVGDVSLEVTALGDGQPLLFLHGEDGLLWSTPLIESLAESFTVHAPHHPGWGDSSRPAYVTTVTDLALVYAEYIHAFASPPIVVGCSLGAWVAAELALAAKVTIAGVVLTAPIGVKLGARDERDFADIYMAGIEENAQLLYGDPSRAPRLGELDDAGFRYLAVAQEATARYCWQPYMHNPKLGYWLRRIEVPTLVVAGSADHFTLIPDYYSRYASLVGPSGAPLETIEGVGHRLEEEAPIELTRIIGEFAAKCASALPLG